MATKFYASLLALLCFCCGEISGQKVLDDQRFDKWYKIVNSDISNNGHWSSFNKIYDNSEKRMVLLNAQTKDTISFKNVVKSFLNNNLFVVLQSDNSLLIINLKTKEKKVIKDVSDFNFKDDFQYGFIITRSSSQLVSICQPFKSSNIAQGVTKIQPLDDDLSLVLGSDFSFIVSYKTGKIITRFDSIKSQELINHTPDISNRLSKFIVKDSGRLKVLFYNWNGEKRFDKYIDNKFNDFTGFGFGDHDMLIASRKNKPISYKDSIENWYSNDLALKPNFEARKNRDFEALLLNLSTGEQISNESDPNVSNRYLIFNDQYILEVLDFANGDSDTEFLIPSIRIRNVYSHKVEFEVQKAKQFYPVGKGVLIYFENRDWWMYNLHSKKKENLTSKINENFYRFNRQNESNINSAGDLFFSNNMSKIYLTSVNNLWEYDLNSKTYKNITNSSDPEVSFKILNRAVVTSAPLRWTRYRKIKENYILIKVSHKDDIREGLSVYDDKKLERISGLDFYKLDQFVCSTSNISFTKENANTPYMLEKYNIRDKTLKVIYESNKEMFQKEKFPKAELIDFRDDVGNTTYVSVILPPGYHHDRKYPAIVCVYENEAASYKTFYFPSVFNQSGFNRSLTAMENYIIILPRIKYIINQPGESALRSVNKAIEIVSDSFSIDQSKIGIMGESFGGFETNYIIAHSGLFKAAISGASLSDITASYFSVSKTNFRPNIWKYTDQSFRFSGNFYDNKNVYFNNNPVFNADKINTPLLLWAGKEDRHVDFEQSIAMFVGLRSLKKPVELMLFPQEGHTLMKPENQKKATQYFLNWFNHYLK
ncbi:prolyl oligopeptidase family serine peptidase [Epilithonimonas sp.]|uniref:alpha/beta hydrolase family protein n=1 Tax=Epilithonimonas sp. TaxID=2894511 RepID=UPI0028A2ACF2|nr:prolyl oligopeptidase family serine peptidase [Epilithonimonas sp.]